MLLADVFWTWGTVTMISRTSFSAVRMPLAPEIAVASIHLAAQSTVAPRELGELPSFGGTRPGPVNAVPGLRSAGVLPVELRIDAIDLDATIEQQQIEDGVMLNPSGPFVVAWYRETGRLGERQNNVVLAGHLDYWDVGPAIFYDLAEMQPGDLVEVIGKNGARFTFLSDWIRDYKMDELDSAAIQEIVGPTHNESLTLITCGGPFDYATGEYESRVIVRASRVNG